ncbi:hypothetical protein PG999_006945 [Apiospora kogelbergensis]|uniref:Uncharacterized protein n=1 Tax=Apiospora kogelbergensis TaxID=1337665 RepID=A0AAW0QWY1_9PEZI
MRIAWCRKLADRQGLAQGLPEEEQDNVEMDTQLPSFAVTLFMPRRSFNPLPVSTQALIKCCFFGVVRAEKEHGAASPSCHRSPGIKAHHKWS